MPRNYEHKTAWNPPYTVQDLQNCQRLIAARRMTYAQASKQFSIPNGVMFRYMHGKKHGRGRPPHLTASQEDELVALLISAARCGDPLTKADVISFVNDYASENKIMDYKIRDRIWKPGVDWYYGFMTRHKDQLSLRKPEQIQSNRFTAEQNPFIVYGFYDLLSSEYENAGIGDNCDLIFNCDETGFALDPSKIRAIGERGSRCFQRLIYGTGREQISVLACVAADGSKLPPFVIYKGATTVQPRWIHPDDYPGTLYTVSENGWMGSEQFLEWFRKGFVPHVSAMRKERNIGNKCCILVFDGHKSHIKYEITKLASDNNIRLIKLPSHLSHHLQPLDKSVFKVLKSAWEKMLASHGSKMMQAKQNTKVTKGVFSQMIGKLWSTKLTEEVIRSGFDATGVYPVNKDKYPANLFDPRKILRWEQIRRPPPEPNAGIPATENCEPTAGAAMGGEQHEMSHDEMLQEPQEESITTMDQSCNDPASCDDKDVRPIIKNISPHSRTSLSDCDTSVSTSMIDLYVKKIQMSTVGNVPGSSKPSGGVRLKCLQYGEVLTSKDVMKRLHEEQQKKASKNEKGVGKKTKPGPIPQPVTNQNRKITNDDKTSDSYNGTDLLPTSRRHHRGGAKVHSYKETRPNSNGDVSVSDSEKENVPPKKMKASTPKVVKPIKQHQYYCVDYVNKWYVGRVLRITNDGIQIKFLERVGSEFRWPLRDDIEEVNISTIFLGPVEIQGSITAFTVKPTPKEIEEKWKDYRIHLNV